MYRATPRDGCAWITGASSGIGRALALRLAADGYRVAVTARRADLLLSLVAKGEGRIHAFPGDITDGAAMAATVATVEATLGPIVLAILNAGLYDPAERVGFDAAVAWRVVETNLGGTIRCLDPVLATMLARGRGQVALVGSLAGYGGLPGSAAYGAAKAGMIVLAEALHLTYRHRGVTVQVVNPGLVRTAMIAGNDYPMPGVLAPERAATLIARGLTRGGFEISFPRRLAWTTKAAALLPYPLWLALIARVTRRTRAR
jgi:short-subunit dehydrogenase